MLGLRSTLFLLKEGCMSAEAPRNGAQDAQVNSDELNEYFGGELRAKYAKEGGKAAFWMIKDGQLVVSFRGAFTDQEKADIQAEARVRMNAPLKK